MGEQRVDIALHTPVGPASPPPLAPSRGKFKQHAGLRTQYSSLTPHHILVIFTFLGRCSCLMLPYWRRSMVQQQRRSRCVRKSAWPAHATQGRSAARMEMFNNVMFEVILTTLFLISNSTIRELCHFPNEQY